MIVLAQWKVLSIVPPENINYCKFISMLSGETTKKKNIDFSKL